MEKDQEDQLDSMMGDDQDSHGGREMVAPPGGSADKPMQVMNKFPNMKETAEEEENMKHGSQVKGHCCVECQKSFRSGKALGGHMSMAYVQANRDLSLRKLKSKRKQPKKLVRNYGGKNICKICRKDFPTKRSLFGHMKCHPDRSWRGMEPPAEPPTNFSDPEFDSVNRVSPHVLDGDQIDSGPVVASSAAGLNEPLKWLVTGKRGREPTLPLQTSEEILAVQQLIKLIDGDSKKPSEDLDSTSSNSWVPEDETDDVNQDFPSNPFGEERDSPVKKLKIWERADENPGGAQLRTIPHNVKGKGKLDPLHPELPPNFSPTGPAAKSVNIPAAAPTDKYICSTCRKGFPTPMALGGHRSSHKKFKVTRIYDTDDDQNGASCVKDGPNLNSIQQFEVNKALGVQNQCNCTGECNHPDHDINSIFSVRCLTRMHGKDGKESVDTDN